MVLGFVGVINIIIAKFSYASLCPIDMMISSSISFLGVPCITAQVYCDKVPGRLLNAWYSLVLKG